MFLTAGTKAAAATVSDERLVEQLRKGDVDGFRFLYRRHFSAAYAYSATCGGTSLDAHELTRLAFVQLLQTLLEGGPRSTRLAGCLRLQLLECVRDTAVQRCSRDGEGFSPRFRQWVEEGARRPLTEFGQLGHEWENASGATRCLVWHALVERDDPALVSRVTGLDRSTIGAFLAEALGPVPPGGPASSSVLAEWAQAESVPVCRPMESLLPALLLGWWPGAEYLGVKRAVPPPMIVPRYLERAIAQARAASGDHGPAPEGATRARRAWGGRVTSAFAVGFVLGVGAGLLLAPVAPL